MPQASTSRPVSLIRNIEVEKKILITRQKILPKACPTNIIMASVILRNGGGARNLGIGMPIMPIVYTFLLEFFWALCKFWVAPARLPGYPL